MEKLLEGDIRSACPERDRLILELLYGSGLRASEVTGINLGDLTAEKTLLVHGKGKKDRLVPVGKCAQRALQPGFPFEVPCLKRGSGRLIAILQRRPTEECRAARRSEHPSYRLWHRCSKRTARVPSPSVAACLCYSLPRPRNATAGSRYHAWTREAFDNANLHASLNGPNAGRVPQGASTCQPFTVVRFCRASDTMF